jgi:chromosome segregation ATPase
MIMSHSQRPVLFSALLVVCAIGAFAMHGSAQVQQPTGPDVLPALLQEVKGLRAAMEQMATSNAHAQLLVGRLQLQESRMNGMIRRLDTVRDDLVKAEGEYAHISGALKTLQGDSSPSDIPEKDRDTAVGGLKQEVQFVKANVDRLRAEETQLTSDLTAEQARWMDINQRLDELERSLKR